MALHSLPQEEVATQSSESERPCSGFKSAITVAIAASPALLLPLLCETLQGLAPPFGCLPPSERATAAVTGPQLQDHAAPPENWLVDPSAGASRSLGEHTSPVAGFRQRVIR